MKGKAMRRLTLAIVLSSFSAAALAGPLNPPSGSVASTGKTLTEVEPRIAINPTNTPGDANSRFKITQPGSYYLTGNITGVSDKHGIEIAAGGVTLDLNGFTLTGVNGSLDGISNDGLLISSITVKNGTVRDWSQNGIGLAGSGNVTNGIIEGVHAESNGTFGIYAGRSFVVTRCTASDNTSTGIATDFGCTVSGCMASSNGGFGVSVGYGSLVRDTIAKANTDHGITTSSVHNSVISCTAFGNGGTGIYANAATLIEGCNVNGNSDNGIRVSGDCVVRNNVCTGHVQAGMANILVEGGSNTRLEGNQASDGTYGIRVIITGTILLRNTCSANTINWSIVAGNSYLIVQAPVTASTLNGNAGGGGVGTTDPNANFTY